MTLRLAIGLALVSGCSFRELLQDAGDAVEMPADSDEYADDETDALETDDAVAYWSLDAILALAGGTLSAEGSSATIGFWTTENTYLCEQTYNIAAIGTPPAPPDEPLVTWWQFSLSTETEEESDTDEETDISNCDSPPPDEWKLGLGAYDSQLDPALNENLEEAASDHLYGTYFQSGTEEETVYIFGVAGTLDQFNGEADPVQESPLPDGSYFVEGLHLLPYEEP